MCLRNLELYDLVVLEKLFVYPELPCIAACVVTCSKH